MDSSRHVPLNALRVFEVVARADSFSSAARSLNVTPAAVMQQVRSLEDHLGLKLVTGSPRGISLTEEGATLSRRLREGFALIAEALDDLIKRDADRPVRVTTTSYFAEAVIFPRVAEFWRETPGIEVSFVSTDDPVDLVEDGFDLAVRAGHGNWPGLTSVPLVESETLACAAPALVDDPDTDWTRVPWLIPGASTWEAAALRASGIDPASIQTMDIGNPSLEVRAAEEGLGIVVESAIDLRQQLARGTLKRAPFSLNFTSRYFVVTPTWAARPSVRAFSDWLRRTCREPAIRSDFP